MHNPSAHSKVAVVHPGTQHSWQTALALQQLDRLEFFATSIFYQPDRWPYRITDYLPERLSRRFKAEFRRMSKEELDPKLVRTHGLWEWLERIARRNGYRDLASNFDERGNRAFGAYFGNVIRQSKPDFVWGFDNAAQELFVAAADVGSKRILDRTIGDWRTYNEIMTAIYDEYSVFFPSKHFLVGEERIDRSDREYELADVILTGSKYANDTVQQNVSPEVASRVRVLTYCFDESLFRNFEEPQQRPRDEPLRFLFVGQAGVRKGIHLVLKVFERVPESAAKLTIVGDMQVPLEVFSSYSDRVTYIPTVARADMSKIMSKSDVLLFPTYFEGAGLVLYEALASGLGIIQSKNADIVVGPSTGILLSEMNEDVLYDAVMTACEDRLRVDSWKEQARIAAQRYSFENYRGSISQLLSELEV